MEWKSTSPTVGIATEVGTFSAPTPPAQPPDDGPEHGFAGARHRLDLGNNERLVLRRLFTCGHCLCHSAGACDRTLRSQFRPTRCLGAQSQPDPQSSSNHLSISQLRLVFRLS